MKVTITVQKEVEVSTLHVKAGARYWEDTEVNGITDEDGKMIPCREADYWCPIIEVDTGKILNWEQGKTANVHYKCCDNNYYTLHNELGEEIITDEGYVASCLCPKENGFGDYIIMDINENGMIQDWEFDITNFIQE